MFIIFIFVVVGDPLTNIGTPPVLEVLLAEGCLALVLVLVLKLLGLGALGRDVALLTTILAHHLPKGWITLGCEPSGLGVVLKTLLVEAAHELHGGLVDGGDIFIVFIIT